MGIEAGEVLMLCIDRLYEGRPDQVDWRLGMLDSAALAVAEGHAVTLLEKIREEKKRKEEVTEEVTG